MEADNMQTDKNVNYAFFYVVYAFSALLAICILFCLGKIIYKHFTERSKISVVTNEQDESMNTQSNSSTQTVLDTQEVNESNPDRLHSQLDKLRRLLNRLNAMGTFSTDTIGDLSAQSTNNINNSIAPSSDLSNFWSSIDFDDVEESTILEDNFRKTPMSNSGSLSVSGISLDSTGINLDNVRHKNIASSSKENAANTVSAALNNKTNPSDAISQILAILEAIILKNRRNTLSKKTSELKIGKNSHESLNSDVVQHLSESKCFSESSGLNQQSFLLASSTSIANKLSSTREYVSLENIASPGYENLEIKTEEIPFIDTTLLSNTELLDQALKILDSQSLMLPSSFIEDENLKSNSCVNEIASSITDSEEKSSENKAFELDKSLVPLFVANIDKDKPLPIQKSQFLRPPSTELIVLNEPYSLQPEKSRKTLSEKCLKRQDAFSLDIQDLKKARSVSKFLDKRVSLVSDSENFMKPFPFDNNKPQITNSIFEENTNTVPEVSVDIDLHFQKKNEEEIVNENKKSESRMLTNNKKVSSVSSSNLLLPSINATEALKSSVSESELKQTLFMDSLSPSISSRNSNSFLSPVLIQSFSPAKEIEWKSPAEPESSTYFLSKVKHQNERSDLKSACIWSTPPSPNKDISFKGIQF